NIHGRKGGRSWRSILLVPKLLAVAMYVGGLAAALAVCLATDPQDQSQWEQLVDSLSAIFIWAAVPGLIAAIILGLLLLWPHRRVLWQQRWLRVKLATLVVAIPLMHWGMSSTLATLRMEVEHMEPGGPRGVLQMFEAGLILALVVAAWIIFLARYKPRFGRPPRSALDR
ncbi:MAG: hypothetical protein OER86_12225, partial [Phycisphaerae bacterium]|nr:hypothetical protein [Phycisphaerae bacterium]